MPPLGRRGSGGARGPMQGRAGQGAAPLSASPQPAGPGATHQSKEENQMKVALFGAGDIGLHQLPGEHPEGELEDLLGGETEMVPINRRLTLVTRRDGEAERLTIRYALHRLGHEPAPIAGECAVVAVGAEGCLLDMGRHDLAAAARYIRPV